MCIQRSVWYRCTYWSLNVKPKIARLHFFVLSYVLIFYCNITNYHQLIISQFLWHSITFTGYFMRASSSAIISVFDTHLSQAWAPEHIRPSNFFWLMHNYQKWKTNFNSIKKFKNNYLIIAIILFQILFKHFVYIILFYRMRKLKKKEISLFV